MAIQPRHRLRYGCFFKDIKVGHIEAGLRSNDKNSPFPEEINRRVASLVTDYHFAPTENAKQNLILENIPQKYFCNWQYHYRFLKIPYKKLSLINLFSKA